LRWSDAEELEVEGPFVPRETRVPDADENPLANRDEALIAREQVPEQAMREPSCRAQGFRPRSSASMRCCGRFHDAKKPESVDEELNRHRRQKDAKDDLRHDQ
jgi:hypothetical protein